MALIDHVTLPFRPGFAATQVTLVLGERLAAEGSMRRRNGYAERGARSLTDANGALDRLLALDGVVISELHASVNTLSEAVGPLPDLAGRHAALEA